MEKVNSASKNVYKKSVNAEALRQAKSLEAQGCAFVSLMDEEGTFLYLSQPHLAAYGRPLSDLIGHKLEEFVVPEDVPHMLLALQDTLLNEESVTIGLRVVTADGSIRRIRGSARQVSRNADGSAIILGNSVIVAQ